MELKMVTYSTTAGLIIARFGNICAVGVDRIQARKNLEFIVWGAI